MFWEHQVNKLITNFLSDAFFTLQESGIPVLQTSTLSTQKKDKFGNLPLSNVVKSAASCVFALVFDDTNLANLASEALQGVAYSAVFHVIEADNKAEKEINQLMAAPGMGPTFVISVRKVQ